MSTRIPAMFGRGLERVAAVASARVIARRDVMLRVTISVIGEEKDADVEVYGATDPVLWSGWTSLV